MSTNGSIFIGAKLKEARFARGLTQTSLSEILGINKQEVSLFENDKRTPSHKICIEISEKLRFPLHFFMKTIYREQNSTIYYRSISSATKKSRDKAEVQFDWLKELIQFIGQYITFPSCNFPPPLSKKNWELTCDDIEDSASSLRRFWNLGDGPISNIVLLVENNGGFVVRKGLEAKSLDAFSEWNTEQERPYMVLNSEKASAARSRFDLAHELGHIMLHRHISRSELNGPRYKEYEKQAHAFAGAFLLPRNSFSLEAQFATLDSLVNLKSKWKVSISAMVMRMYNLGLITEYQEKRFFANIARRRWRTVEPLDDSLEPEKPQMLLKTFELLLSNHVISKDDIEQNIGLYKEDIDAIAGLNGFLLSSNIDARQFPRLCDN